MKGNSLSAEERNPVEQKLARYTGLSQEFVRRSHWRIDPSRFRKELLRDKEQIVGRYDSRCQGADLELPGSRPEYDPSYAVVQGSFTALINQYLREELKYETDLTYRILTDQVQPWNFGSAQNRYLNVAPALRQAMTKNPQLHVLVVSGWYDLATPFLATALYSQPPGAERFPGRPSDDCGVPGRAHGVPPRRNITEIQG